MATLLGRVLRDSRKLSKYPVGQSFTCEIPYHGIGPGIVEIILWKIVCPRLIAAIITALASLDCR
jgi:hypothetical protein